MMEKKQSEDSVKRPASAEAVIATLKKAGSPESAAVLRKFFKTGKGQYGEGDCFLGVRNPQTRGIAKNFSKLPLSGVETLLASEFHEVRLCGLLIAAGEYAKGGPTLRQAIFDFYLAHTDGVNNWDLVDLSAPDIVGIHLLTHDREILFHLAKSENLWEQRIAMVATLSLIRHGEFQETFRLVEGFLTHRHDLMHKACGWMLREVGKRNRGVLTEFLEEHKTQMPRTMLRYAIEHYPQAERRLLLGRSVASATPSHV